MKTELRTFGDSSQEPLGNEGVIGYLGVSGLSEKLKDLEKGGVGSIELLVTSETKIALELESGEMGYVVLDDQSVRDYNITRGSDGSILQDGAPVHALFEEFYLSCTLQQGSSEISFVPKHHFHMDIRTVGYETAVFNDASGRVNSDPADYALRNRHDRRQQPLLDELRAYVACVVEATGVMPSVIVGGMGFRIPSEQIDDFLNDGSDAHTSN